jgi:hypothetical protein
MFNKLAFTAARTAILKIAFAATTAAILAGASTTARADVMIEDANTGLNQFYHVGTIAELAARGLPLKASAQAYVRSPGSAAGRRGNVYLLEDRGAFGSAGASAIDQDRKHDGHW